MWKTKLSDGSLFGDKLIATMAKVLELNAMAEKEGRDTHGKHCKGVFRDSCVKGCVVSIVEAMGVAKRPIRNIVDFDWTTMLNFQRVSPAEAMKHFSVFHGYAGHALTDDPTNKEARDFLKKLGASKKLLHRILEWVISGEAEADSMEEFIQFINKFVRCLIRPPSDNKTSKLLKRAGSVFKRWALSQTSPPSHTANYTIALMESKQWNELLRYSDEECWQFYKANFMKGGGMKTLRQAMRERRTTTTERMCAHCFTLEKDLPPGKSLEICSRCRQICYCGRMCQLEHWNAHKTQCKK